MTHDPIQPLADIGRRVLRTARYLTVPHAPDQHQSYATGLRDPLVSLSGLCNGLLEGFEASPVAVQPEDSPYEPGSRLAHTRNPGAAFPTLSRPDVPADESGESAGARRGNQVRGEYDTPGPGTPSAIEEPRRSIAGPAPSPDEPDHRDPWEATVSREPGEEPPQTESREAPPGPEVARRAPRSRDLRYPVRRLPGAEHPTGSNPNHGGSGSELPVRKDWPENGQTGFADVRESDVPVEYGQARGVAESAVPLRDSRLTASTERLAAMLRSHVAPPETARAESQEDRGVFAGPQGDDERDVSRSMGRARTQPAGLAGVEEIMERIADELETEFVRTYGRSGA